MKKSILDSGVFKLVIAILIPVVGFVFLLLINHVGLKDISLISSGWNDEAFYYKQIEGMVKYGIPQGYYGFNESTSVIGHFAAWPPSLLYPYVLVGLIFEWSSLTPVLFHLVLWIIAFAVFAQVLKPSFNQLLSVGALWLSYHIGIRYIFSATPESMLSAFTLIFFCLFIRAYREDAKTKWVVWCDIVVAILTLMRGYYGVFGLLIWYLMWDKRKSIKAVIAQMGISLLSLIPFVVMLKLCVAPYYTNLTSTDWLTNPKAFVKLMVFSFIETLEYIKDAFISLPHYDAMRGTWYFIYYVVGIWVIYRFVKTKSKYYIVSFVAWAALLSSMWLLYIPKEGSRQLMATGLCAILAFVYIAEKNRIYYVVPLMGLFIFLTWFSKADFYTRLPIKDTGILEVAEVEKAYDDLVDLIPISDDPWDNTVIISAATPHIYEYSLPAGLGINSCEDSYIEENIDNLKAKYIITCTKEDIDSFISNKGYDVIYSYGEANIYCLR